MQAYVEWEGYVRQLGARFDTQAFDDPIFELSNLKQTYSLAGYFNAFDELYPKAAITKDQALTFSLSG